MRGRPKGPLSELAALAELGRVLGTGPHLSGALSRVVEHLEEMVGASSVGVWLRDQADAELRLVAATGVTWQSRQRTRHQVGDAITSRVVESGRPVVVPRVSKEPLFVSRGNGPRSGS